MTPLESYVYRKASISINMQPQRGRIILIIQALNYDQLLKNEKRDIGRSGMIVPISNINQYPVCTSL
jgi:hypothetical protein